MAEEPEALREKEESGGVPEHEDQVGRGYIPNTDAREYVSNRDLGALSKIKPTTSGVLKFARQNRGKFFIGGAAASLVTLLIIGFFILLPFKILHIVNNLQSHFFSTSENAVQRETDQLFSAYVKKYVLPGLRTCRGSTIDKSCTPRMTMSDSLVGNLYRGWARARFENKLAENYGIEFKRVQNTFYLKTPQLDGDGLKLPTDFDSSSETLDQFFERSPELNKYGGRNEFRRAVKQSLSGAMEGQSRWKKVMYRYKVGRLVETKYGVKRCIIGCRVRDDFADWRDNKKMAHKMWVAQRILQPRTEMFGLLVECVLTQCDPTNFTDSHYNVDKAGCTSSCLNGGEAQSDADRLLRARIFEAAQKFGVSYDDINTTYKEMSEKGFRRYLFEQAIFGVLTRTGDAKAAERASSIADKLSTTATTVGLIFIAANVWNEMNLLPATVQHMSYVMNATTMVQTYSMYRTDADEMKDGNIDATLFGAMTSSLDPGTHNPDGKGDIQVGGTAGAEQTPLYNVLLGDGRTVGSKTYKCTEGRQDEGRYTDFPQGAAVCPEENLSQIANLAAYVKNIKENCDPVQVCNTLDAAAHGVGKLQGLINSAIGLVLKPLSPLFTAAIKAIIDFAGQFDVFTRLANLAEQILGVNYNLIGDNNSGGRMFDIMAGGADVLGNDFAHNGLGGVVLTQKQLAQIRNGQEDYAQAQFANLPLSERLFSRGSDRSMMARMATAMPATPGEALSSFGNFITHNPFGHLAGSFGTIFNPGRAHAAALASDPFGITQYGYPQDNAIWQQDPEQYWLDNCTTPTKTKTYNDNAANTVNQDTQMPENPQLPKEQDPYQGTDPCLLIQAAAGSAGATSTTKVLTSEDLEGSESDSATVAGANIDMAHLFDASADVACAPQTKDLGIQDGYHNGQLVKIRICAIPGFPSSGQESNNGYGITGANGQAIVNSRVSGAVLAMIKAAKASGLQLSASSTFRTMAHQQALCPCDGVTVAIPGTSNHQMGLAIDFSGLPSSPGPIPGNEVWEWLSKNAGNFGYRNYDREAWHWSPDGH